MVTLAARALGYELVLNLHLPLPVSFSFTFFKRDWGSQVRVEYEFTLTEHELVLNLHVPMPTRALHSNRIANKAAGDSGSLVRS